MTQVLITTSNGDLASIVRETLNPTHIEFMITTTVRDAIRVLQGSSMPDLLVVDVVTDGALDFIGQMKSSAKFNQLPVLAVIDDPDPNNIKKALDIGANRWITQGFIPTTLQKVIRQVLSSPVS